MAIDSLPHDVEYYGSSDDVLREDDIIETDVKVVGWQKKFRIRALTFGQMENINRKALDKDGNLQHDLFVYWTIVEGVTRPRFKIDQAERLAHSNGTFVQELSDEIWRLGRVSKELWDTFVEEATRSIKLEKGDFKDEKPAQEDI